MVAGIYEIYSIKCGKRYIGSSKNVEQRWNAHIRDLRKGSHHNYHLQQAYHRYGEDDLIFTLLETIEPDEDILEREEHYINRFKFNKLFNVLRKPGEQPRYQSRWMSFCNQDRSKKKQEEWGWESE